MKRIILLLFVCFAFSSGLQAQQYLQQTQFFSNLAGINPAYSGWKNTIQIRSGYRKEWTGFEDSPQAYFMTFNVPVNNPEAPQSTNYSLRVSDLDEYRRLVQEDIQQKTRIRHGVGGYLLSEDRGLFTNTTAALSYAFHVAVSKKAYLSVGAAAKFNNYRFNKVRLTVANPEDPLYQEFQRSPDTRNGFDLNAGVLLYHPNYYLSYSAVQLLPNDLLGAQGWTQQDIQHFMIAGTKFSLSDNFQLEPSVLTKVSATGTSVMGNVLLHYGQLWGGLGYGDEAQTAAYLGLKLGKLFQVGYSYDFNFSELGNYNQGSHEIVIGLDFPRFPASILYDAN